MSVEKEIAALELAAGEEIDSLRIEIRRLRQEIAERDAEIQRHHADFLKWEEMAASGAGKAAVNRKQRDALWRVLPILRSLNNVPGLSVDPEIIAQVRSIVQRSDS